MKKILPILLLIALLWPIHTAAQRRVRQNENSRGGILEQTAGPTLQNDTTGSNGRGGSRISDRKTKSKKIPTGIKAWTLDDRFGIVDSTDIDTLPHAFQNTNFSDGLYGEYNTLGNMGSPRQSRLFTLRSIDFSQFIFTDPHDYFITPFSQVQFTNTKSPFTNVTYHECGNRDDGEDRFKALFAVNASKDIGLGFKLDYLYGRGYFDHQSTSDFGGTLWGSVDKEKYRAHFTIYTNYLKTAENGGITSDDYVRNPENFPSRFDTKDIPTNLDKVWNKIHADGAQLTHSYSLGFRRYAPDSTAIVCDTLPQAPDAAPDTPLAIRTDTLRFRTDSTGTFIPVTSFIHTLKVENNRRKFIANEDLSGFYTDNFMESDSTSLKFSHTNVTNVLAIQLNEGFNRWAVAGIRLFAQHDYDRFSQPKGRIMSETANEHTFTLGGALFREQGKKVNFNLLAQVSGSDSSFGEFELDGNASLRFNLLGKEMNLRAFTHIVNREPTYFYRHFHSHHIWWDNDFKMQASTRVGGTVSNELTRTRLTLEAQNISHYTYFASTAARMADAETETYTMGTEARQAGDDIQLLSLRLGQDFRLGILNWENQLTYQTTSDKHVYPLPTFNAYTNLYLLFRIAKVLRVEFGADMRYFTKYEAPAYSPELGMFAIQAPDNRIKEGGHPVINVYANFHLKHTRFYVMAHHVNYTKEGGNVFLAPHYPYNPFILKFGLSWNFFN